MSILLFAGMFQGLTHALKLEGQIQPVYSPADTMASGQVGECCSSGKCAINTAGDIASFAKQHIGDFFGSKASDLSSLAMAVTGSNGSECQAHQSFGGGTSQADCWRQRFCGNDWPEKGATMVGLVRLSNVAELIHYVHNDGVPGAFAELGVWRGGTCIFAHHAFRALDENNKRSVHVFDAFDKLPGYGKSEDFLANSEAYVHSTFEQYGAMDSSIKFHVGLFKETTKAFRAEYKLGKEKIAILRVDGNFYDSYQDAMYDLYEYVPAGGFVIFDDVMSHPAVRQFWADFKKDQGLPENLVRIDRHSAFFRKEAEITLDQSKRHPPRDANL